MIVGRRIRSSPVGCAESLGATPHKRPKAVTTMAVSANVLFFFKVSVFIYFVAFMFCLSCCVLITVLYRLSSQRDRLERTDVTATLRVNNIRTSHTKYVQGPSMLGGRTYSRAQTSADFWKVRIREYARPPGSVAWATRPYVGCYALPAGSQGPVRGGTLIMAWARERTWSLS